MKDRLELLAFLVVFLLGLVLTGCEKKNYDHYLQIVEVKSVSGECVLDDQGNIPKESYIACSENFDLGNPCCRQIAHNECVSDRSWNMAKDWHFACVMYKTDPDNPCCEHIAHGAEVFCEAEARGKMMSEALEQCLAKDGNDCQLGAGRAKASLDQELLNTLHEIGFYDETTELGSCWAQ